MSPLRGAHYSASGAVRRGFILVGILVLVMLISMIAVSLLFRLRAEDTAASAGMGAEQAWAAAMAGVREAMRVAVAARPGSIEWQDNPGAFRQRFVYDDGADQWFFTVYSRAGSDSLEEIRYGLTDEGGKLNLNHADFTDFSHFPGLEAAPAAALQTYLRSPRSSSNTVETAEGELLPPPVSEAASGPFDSLDQLLQVEGFSPGLLYGEDYNQNWRLDPNEDDGDERFPPDNSDGKLDLGLRRLWTVYSYELNEDNDGMPRANLNEPRESLPAAELPEALTNFVAAARIAKIQFAHPADLLEATVKVPDGKGGQTEIHSGVGREELPAVLNHFTTSRDYRQPGLINVNTADIPVLASVPGIDGPLAEAIVSTRVGLTPERRATIAWLFQEGVVDAARFKSIAPHLTARSFQYSFHSVGYAVPSGRFRVLDVTIDLAGGEPRVISLRDLTRLGMPFQPEAGQAATPLARAPHRKESVRG
jgi:DNA uptake protein ComE-like DNA-binding protein